MLNRLWIKAALLYNRFQALFLSLFLFGLLDLLVYSDVLMTLFAFPEAVPLAILMLVAFGVWRMVRKKRRKKQATDDSHPNPHT
ncbi:MAG TPA: hypothetical protein VFV52_16095 [Bacilli bacterium]|nr:hypothetical protein [Bacilli bacterium]